jgi:hypothetical protein
MDKKGGGVVELVCTPVACHKRLRFETQQWEIFPKRELSKLCSDAVWNHDLPKLTLSSVQMKDQLVNVYLNVSRSLGSVVKLNSTVTTTQT